MTDRLQMIVRLVELAEEAKARGDLPTSRTLREVGDYLMRIHGDLTNLEERRARDRRAAKKKLRADDTLRGDVWARDAGRCVLCSRSCRPEREHRDDFADDLGEIDHILAIALGGTNTFENLRLLCRGCHRTKSARDRIAIRAARSL